MRLALFLVCFLIQNISSKEYGCRLYDSAQTSNASFDRIQINARCLLRICFKLESNHFEYCENHVKDSDFILKRSMPDSFTCDCNQTKRNLILSFTPCHRKEDNLIKLETSNGQSTFKFVVQPIYSDVNCFVLKLGSLRFNFTTEDISLINSNLEQMFYKKSINKQLIQFNASAGMDIWVSVNELFIKIGTNSLSNSNILFEFEPVNQMGKDLIRSIDYMVIDNRFKLASEPVQSLSSFYSELNPIIKKDAYYETFPQLALENQHLFSLVKDFNLTSSHFDSINYSLNTCGCELNKTSGTISSLIETKYGIPLLVEIWPQKYSKKLMRSFKSYGISKILKGQLNFKYAESLDNYLVNQSMALWMSPQMFNVYQVFKPFSDSIAVTVSSLENFRNFKVNHSFEELINLVSHEYNTKKCNQNLSLNDSLSLIDFKFKAKVNLNGTNLKTNMPIRGQFNVEQIDDNHIQINGSINGLSPNSFHAIHIHESSETRFLCKDTGPHFNPLFSDEHGSPDDHMRNKHFGDLGNLKTDSSGQAFLNKRLTHLTIKWRNVFNILYRTIVIHRDTDDLGRGNHVNSKSNGNSGPRIACGIILPIE